MHIVHKIITLVVLRAKISIIKKVLQNKKKTHTHTHTNTHNQKKTKRNGEKNLLELFLGPYGPKMISYVPWPGPIWTPLDRVRVALRSATHKNLNLKVLFLKSSMYLSTHTSKPYA